MAALESVILILLAFFLVLLNGFFVLVEFSLVKVRRTRLELLAAEEPSPGRARVALTMHHKLDEYLSATQLGITVASLGLGWIGKPAFAGLFQKVLGFGPWSEALSVSASVVLAFGLITFLHILIGELAPKSLAIQRAERSILWAGPLMRVFHWIFYVPLIILTKGSNMILHLLGLPPTSETETAVSEQELRLVLGHSQREGEFSLDRLLLFENMLDLSGMSTSNIMRPLASVDMIDETKTWEANREILLTKGHSRYPVCSGNPQDIVGMVHIKELGLKALEGVEGFDLSKFRRDVSAVRDTTPLESLLREFQRRRQHMAVVKNSKGRIVGVVTLEDILEELVGEIVDEFDEGVEKPLALGDIISAGNVIVNLEAEDRKDAIQRMLVPLESVPEIDPEGAFNAVWKREREAPTGLGRGIAVPHGRLPGLTRPYMVFARCPQGIDFLAADDQPATLLFLILTPSSHPALQTKVLARVAGLLQSGYLTDRLSEAKTESQVMEIIKAGDVASTL